MFTFILIALLAIFALNSIILYYILEINKRKCNFRNVNNIVDLTSSYDRWKTSEGLFTKKPSEE